MVLKVRRIKKMGRTEAVQTLVVDFNVTIACLCLLLVFVLEKRAY